MKTQDRQRLIASIQALSVALSGAGLTACASELSEQPVASSWSTAYPGKADIYGEDSRRELNDPSVSSEYQTLSDSVAMVFSTPSLLDVTEGEIVFSKRSMSDKFMTDKSAPLCDGEAYKDQVAPGYCSAFLIAPDLMATAGHCVNGHTRCEQMGFAFGYALERPDDQPVRVSRDEFYRCESIIGRLYNPGQERDALLSAEYWYDWAVIKLDRPVTGHRPVKLAPPGERLERGAPLVMIGHPSGLPMKVTEGAVVTSDKERYFNTNLDTYQGNSGSAVFGVEDERVHGILIRGSGGNSFELVSDGQGGSCGQSKVCDEVGSATGCIGNHALRVDPLHMFLGEGLKVSERHTLLEDDRAPRVLQSFSFDEAGQVEFATIHVNGGAANPRDIRVILHHEGQSVELISDTKNLPYGRWSATTPLFNGLDVAGEWVIELINEGSESHSFGWTQVMLGRSSSASVEPAEPAEPDRPDGP